MEESQELKEAMQDASYLGALAEVSREFTEDPTGQDQYPNPENRNIRGRLRTLASRFWYEDYRARTWGYVVVRTTYGDDEFNGALEKINQYIQLSIEWEARFVTAQNEYRSRWDYWPEGYPTEADDFINKEFFKRFVNDPMEDAEALDGATTAKICNYFKEWALARWHMEPYMISAASPRLKSCIVLDAETIEQLKGMPEDLLAVSHDEITSIGAKFWVKMAEVEPQPRSHAPAELADIYRVHLIDLEQFWFIRDIREPSSQTSKTGPQDSSIHYW